MIAYELINELVPPLKTTDMAHKAITWMEELRLAALPVVQEGRFLGLISDEIIYDSNELDVPVADYDLDGQGCFVFRTQHLYDIVGKGAEHHSQLVAVLEETGEYLGVATLENTIEAFAQTASVQSQGGILVLRMNAIDYSMAEISRLIEAEDAKILGSSITNDEGDPNKMELTLKINQPDLSRVIAMLERFGYLVSGRFHEANTINNDRERLDNLMRFINI